ncbi:MAG: 50S ribosomal protein L11 methyltransferase [Alphaproteobacteria bacterium]|nr:50S ribosomal protein L11 methyltransferase [Alphaproteobacteria bacterium]
MAVKYVWSLTITVPQSVIEDALMLLPEGEVGQTAFKADAEDRSANPAWIAESLYIQEPEIKTCLMELSILSGGNNHAPYRHDLQKIPAQGWLQANQDSFAPNMVGGVVIHGEKDKSCLPSHRANIELEASCAFGTGEHPTTYGCLTALQALHHIKPHARVLDLGAGSAVLAMAMAKLFKTRVVATDMDADSVIVAEQNCRKNGVARFVTNRKAMGFAHAAVLRQKPYDVILSNIFARPLAKLAPEMRKHLKPGGIVILAGFLHKDVARVANAYAMQRIYVLRRLRFGNWCILVLKKQG